jgi:hypothetical protein
MPEQIVLSPACEPVDIAQARLFCRITDMSEDETINMCIAAARQFAETRTRQQFLHARWKLTVDKFPMGGYGTPLPFADMVNRPEFAFRLPHSPLVDVVNITYLDMGGNSVVADPASYVINNALTPGIVSIRFGQIWPIPLPQIAAVQVTYDAGYASPMTVVTPPGSTLRVVGPVTWQVGATVQFYNSGGALPAALKADASYLIASAANGVYSLTDMAGTAIAFADAGSGTNFIGVVPAGLRHWICLRTGSLFDQRAEVAILNRGKVELLPFVETLLDPYCTSLP